MKKLFTLLTIMGLGPAFMTQALAADKYTNVNGIWAFTLGDYYYDNSIGVVDVNYTASLESGNIIQFDDPSNEYWAFNGIYAPATRVITFQKEYIGNSDNYYIYQEPYVLNEAGDDVIFQNFTAQVSEDFTSISFQSGCGIAWKAYKDEAGTQFEEYYAIYDFLKAGRPLYERNWKDVGMAKFMDGWILPALGFDQYENEYDVMLQQYDGNDNLYRLVDPYKSGPAAEYNTSETGGYIQFDVTDPDHVVFTQSDAGFAYSTLGISTFYTYNMLGYYLHNNPTYTAEEIIQIRPMPFTTFKDGVVSLEYYINNDRVTVYDANYGTQLIPGGGQVWQYSSGARVDMTTTITFPQDNAVESVFGEDENAPVEYYNLQGVKILNPAPGQILIKRQGSKAIKIKI